jgi:WD40 repeat protein
VSSSGDGGVYVWDAADGHLLQILPGMSARSWANHFSPDGARIAAGSNAGEIVIWGIPGE